MSAHSISIINKSTRKDAYYSYYLLVIILKLPISIKL